MNVKHIARIVIALGLLSFSSISWAGCSVYGGAYSYSATLPTQTITVPRNTPVGTPVGSVMSVGSGSARTIVCSGGASYTHLKFGTALTPSDSSGIYKTNIDGIGIKVWDDFYSSDVVTVENNIKRWYLITNASSYIGGAWLTNIKARYYVIGPVTAGNISVSNIVVEAWANTATTTSGGAMYNKLTMSGTAIVNASACETPDISVNLNKHKKSDFPSVGSTSATTPFTFKINNCSTGMTSVNYTFKPAPGITLNGSGTGQYLSLDASSTASGVGVQVLYENGANVPFNTKNVFAGYSKTIGGSYTIPMKARYIRTGNIRSGSANSAVEFTMSYE